MNDNLVKCPDCGAEVSRRASACPKCGAPIAAPKGENVLTRNRGCGDLILWPILLLIILFLASMLFKLM